jgi:hypothetical protein
MTAHILDELMAKAFTSGRTPRSPEYKQGVRDLLYMRFEGDQVVLPFEIGTARRG